MLGRKSLAVAAEKFSKTDNFFAAKAAGVFRNAPLKRVDVLLVAIGIVAADATWVVALL